ncbi:MAG: GDP-mannose 4,6-dehydratase [Candidatus Eisenbacteria bacterium]|nr:GDP-mannose 4,6-dehydratase [Candidatus Eisenbacteria bacterium]
MTLRGRSVLVTGANGFVGPHVVRALAAAGARVHGAGLGSAPADSPLDSWCACDVLDPAASDAAVSTARPDAVVHLAGQSSAARSFEQPVETFRLNVAGTALVLEALLRVAPKARVLVVGSSEVYGPQPEGSRVAEDAPFRPVSPYALSKAAAESLALTLAAEHGLDVVATRSFGHTGPGQDARFAVPSFAQQIAAIEAGRAEPVLHVGNLEVTRDLCDVRDVAHAYVALLERGAARRVYNVCRGEGVGLTTLVESLVAMARATVRIEPDPARMRPADLPWLVGDPSAIARDTDWRAGIALEQTLADVLEEWRGRERAGG